MNLETTTGWSSDTSVACRTKPVKLSLGLRVRGGAQALGAERGPGLGGAREDIGRAHEAGVADLLAKGESVGLRGEHAPRRLVDADRVA
eukprot:6150169-Prymnesium_polylepis.1